MDFPGFEQIKGKRQYRGHQQDGDDDPENEPMSRPWHFLFYHTGKGGGENVASPKDSRECAGIVGGDPRIARELPGNCQGIVRLAGGK